MDSIIKQLQLEATRNNSSVAELLRQSKIVASKLGLGDFLKWIDSELNGYGNRSDIPDYREIEGDPRGWNPYHGWVPVLFTNDPRTQELISRNKVNQAIGTLEDLVRDNGSRNNLQMPFPAAMNQQISKYVDMDTKFALFVSCTSIISILDAVRNIILDWSIKLEKEGVLGDGISFSEAERKMAQARVVYNIKNIESFAGNMGPMKDHSRVQIKDGAERNIWTWFKEHILVTIIVGIVVGIVVAWIIYLLGWN